MTEQSSTVQDPAEPVTTSAAVETIQQTATGTSVTSPTSRDLDFYFRCAVVVIGVVGTAANALVLYAMVASGEHKKHVLILNQNALDFASCFFLVVTYAVILCNIPLTGTHGYWLCLSILGETLYWSPLLGSTINLATISIERYLKIVHSSWSKTRLSNRMIYAASAFAWIGSTVIIVAATFSTTKLVDGICYVNMFWESDAAQMVYGIWYFLSFDVILLAIFIFCYWRILVVIRRQAKVMSGHVAAGPGSTHAHQSHKIQSNIIKTMSTVTVFFVLSWTPLNVYYSIVVNDSQLSSVQNAYYYPLIFMAFLYICTINPFIYATKFDPVKGVLLRLIPCKNSVQPVLNVAPA